VRYTRRVQVRDARVLSSLLVLGALGCNSSGAGPTAAFSVVMNGTTHLATSTADPTLQVEIDCDDDTGDGHFFGITPIVDGKRLEITMWGALFPFVTPDFDAGEIACIGVQSDATQLTVRFEAGSYAGLVPTAPAEPVPLSAELYVGADGHLAARLSGLYYMFPTAQGTTLAITDAAGATTTRTVTPTSPMSTEYFDDVASVLVQDGEHGEIAMEGSIRRLQMQVWDLTMDGGFELDTDHAFKDLGQASVDLAVTFR